MNLVTWIMGLVAPLVIRAVIALGFTAVTYTGVTALANQLMATAQTQWATLPLNLLQLAELSGLPESLGMIAGAFVARVALWASLNGVKYVLKAP